MTSPVSTAALTVLVVDDEAAIVEFITYSLKQWGYKVISACSASDAMDALKKSATSPTLAIIDIALGEDSGLTLAVDLVSKLNNLRILFVSGYVDDMLMIDSLPGETRTAFLQKVFTCEQLQESLAELAQD